MATITDIPVTSTWQNVHTMRGLAVGSSIYVQNKTSASILLNINVASPAPVDNSGMIVAGNDYTFLLISPGTNETLWVKNLGNQNSLLGVQQ